jgi:hypothetical protein
MPTTAARTARALHRLIEPLHTPLYFAADVRTAFADIGLEPLAQGYVAGRAAPLGRVDPGPVAAIFFNFHPTLIGLGLPAAWDIASPREVLRARAGAVEAMFQRAGAPTDGLAEATELAGQAAAAAEHAGRPLASANAAVEPPGTPFADLWQTLTVLREHRGDGHVALLTASGVAPVDVLVLYAAWQGMVSRRFLQRSRLWDDDAWSAAEERLRTRGWLDDAGSLTAEGQAWRDRVETDTDQLAAAPYAALGVERSRRLFDLLRPLAVALDAADDVFPKPLQLPETFDTAAL